MNSEHDANMTTDYAQLSPYSEGPNQTREDDLWVPAVVELSDDGVWLRYRDRVGERNPRRTRPSKVMLARFLDLHRAEEPGRTVLAFAKKWGVLNLCERHELPCEHARMNLRDGDADAGDAGPYGCEPRPADGSPTQVVVLQGETRAEELGWRLPEFPGSREPNRWWNLEPVARWVDYSRQFSEVLALATELRGNPPPYWWASGGDAKTEWTRAELDSNPYVRAEKLLRRTQQWQDYGHVRDVLQWTQGGLVPIRAGSGLFGALVIKLLDAIRGGAHDMFRCGNCGELGRRKGRSRKWCDKPECQRAQAAKAAKKYRERRQNKAQARH